MATMGARFSWVGGAGLGAALMYFMDPDRGRRRRAMLRDRCTHVFNKAAGAADTSGRDLRQRAYGMAADLRGRLREGVLGQPVDDVVVEERVRAHLGRVAQHPGAIEVTAHGGHVTLRGPVLAGEADLVATTARAVRGVKGITDALQRHQRAGDVPGLQGGGTPPEPRIELLQANWSPATRVLASAAGGLLAWNGMTMNGPFRWALAIMGGALVTRSATNIQLMRLVGLGGGRRAVDVHKTINVASPPDEVYAFWRHCENFPRFMAHVKGVRDLGNGRTHWTVAGPTGAEFRWDAMITRDEPGRMLAWRSLDGATIRHAGIVRFTPNIHRGTQVDVQMSYNPPGGAIGHAIASLLGCDPKTAMDQDLVRMKSLIEQGRASAPGKTATREELRAASM